MSYINTGLTISMLISQLVAAFYWYHSSIIKIDPGWTTTNPEPVVPELRQMDWNSAIIAAASTSANLNKAASLWTALAVALGFAMSIVGIVKI